MSNSINTGVLTRRDMLLLIGAAMIPGVVYAALPTSTAMGYFGNLRRVAELELLSLHMKSVLSRESVDVINELQQWSASSASCIRTVIGDQWETLEHSIPTLVDDDLLAGRTREVMGLHFTATELAMLLTDD